MIAVLRLNYVLLQLLRLFLLKEEGQHPKHFDVLLLEITPPTIISRY